jgi:hypothetical protein
MYWVRIATGYGLDDPFSNTSSTRIFLFSTASRPTLRPTQLHFLWVLVVLLSGVKRQGLEANHSPASSAEAKKDGVILVLLHTLSWYKHRDKFTFFNVRHIFIAYSKMETDYISVMLFITTDNAGDCAPEILVQCCYTLLEVRADVKLLQNDFPGGRQVRVYIKDSTLIKCVMQFKHIYSTQFRLIVNVNKLCDFTLYWLASACCWKLNNLVRAPTEYWPRILRQKILLNVMTHLEFPNKISERQRGRMENLKF